MSEASTGTYPDEAPEQAPLSQFRCIGCGYGASCRIQPQRCPMCGNAVWHSEEWRPLSQLLADLDTPLMRDQRL